MMLDGKRRTRAVLLCERCAAGFAVLVAAVKSMRDAIYERPSAPMVDDDDEMEDAA
jgi:hypothetical protein